jgi:hypothetical protein
MHNSYTSELWSACAQDIHWIECYCVLEVYISEEVHSVHFVCSSDHSSDKSRLHVKGITGLRGLSRFLFSGVTSRQWFDAFVAEQMLQVSKGIPTFQYIGDQLLED